MIALIEHESSYTSDLISETDDYGLMQINRQNHEMLSDTLGVQDYLEPHENIIAGCYVLHELFQKYQDTEKVLMAYNFGEYGASVLWEQGIYSSDYSKSILQIQARLNGDE